MTQLSRSSLFGFAFIFLSSGVCDTSLAQSTLLQLKPDTDVEAQVKKTEKGYFIVQPDGSELQMIDAEWVKNFEGDPIFTVADYNFDGFPDVAIGAKTSDSPDTGFGIFLYDADNKSYVPLHFSEAFNDRLNCRGLWNVELIESQNAIKSSCYFEGDDDTRVDILQIDPDASPHLLEQSRAKEEAWHWPYIDRPARMITYDREGNITLETIADQDDTENSWTVPVIKLEIYSKADPQTRTPAYLLEGETVRILAFSGEFMKFAREGSTGMSQGWVSLTQAYDLVSRYDTDGTKPQMASLALSDYKDIAENPDYYRNLFTLTLKNTGNSDMDLSNAELFLLFNGDNGTRVAHKLYDISGPTLKPGESHMIDDNPIEQRDGKYVIYHNEDGQDSYPLFFPAGLPDGKYRVIPMITDPALSGFIYGKNEIELEFPPKLDASLIKN